MKRTTNRIFVDGYEPGACPQVSAKVVFSRVLTSRLLLPTPHVPSYLQWPKTLHLPLHPFQHLFSKPLPLRPSGYPLPFPLHLFCFPAYKNPFHTINLASWILFSLFFTFFNLHFVPSDTHTATGEIRSIWHGTANVTTVYNIIILKDEMAVIVVSS